MKKSGRKLTGSMTPAGAWAMAFGCMVGWGAFVMPGTTFLPVAGPLGTAAAMLIGTAIMLIIGCNFSWLMKRSPRTGGVYSYTKEAFGRDHAFLGSWFLCLSYLTIVFLNGTAVFVVIKTLAENRAQSGAHYTIAGSDVYLSEVLISAAVMAGIGILYVAARSILQRVQIVLAIILLAGIIVTSAICLPAAVRDHSALDFGASGVSPAYGIFSIVMLSPWAFVGFEIISFDTADFSFSVKKGRGIVMAAIALCAFSYASMAAAGAAFVPDGYAGWQDYINDLDSLSGVASVPTFYAAQGIMGSAGIVIVTVTAFAAILTGIIAAYRAAMRILSAMAEDRILSEYFANTTYSILFVMGLSILAALLGRNTLSWFIDLTSFGAIVGFGYTSAAAYKIARAESNRPVMITGMSGAVISAAFLIVQLVPSITAMETMGAESFLLLSLWCLLGFVFYWRTVKHSTLTEYSGISTSGVVLFALLLYAALMWIFKMLNSQSSLEGVHDSLRWGSAVFIAIAFVGLAVMLYIQKLVREKHEASEREKIRAVEGSLAKSQFLFNMSHDIRTPMNAITGYTDLALKEPSPPVVHDYLEKIELSSRHLLNLINDILEMSRIESGTMELEFAPVDIRAVFTEMRDLFAEQMKDKSIDFGVYTGQVHDPYVWCDKRNLDRVLLNLISNAYKFTPEGGTISVSIAEAGSDENGYASYEIRIQDNGIGMSEDFSDRMFNAFERERTSTDSGVEGTGLGLAITKSIIDLMGGTIEVLTSPGNGTTVVIALKFQLADEEDVEVKPAEPVKAEMDYSSKRLLVVEDNAINMEIAVMILEQTGFKVDKAVNGKEAVDMVAASEHGCYDAVLMDIQMPVMDGYTAAREIRSLDDPVLAGIPILAMTANAFKEDEEAAYAAGMQAHIAKPIDINDMLGKITAAIE